MVDSDVDSTTVVTHFRSCTIDLCNDGDGLNFLDEGHELESVAILVPDKRSSATLLKISHLTILLYCTVSFVNFIASINSY